MSNFEDSILRILRGNSVVGAAFLVSDCLVVTCAHVVKSAGAEIGGKISLRLSDGKEIDAIVEPEFWREANAEDISILKLNKPLENLQPVIFGSSSGTKGHTFSTFGFPRKGQELAGGGEIIGLATIGGIKLLQLRSPEVTPGFSGAPIFDEVTKRVVGMIVAITPPDEYLRLGTTAFAIPSEIIREICSDLQISDICPYRSLDVFNEEDAPFFFGRDGVVQRMLNSLTREPRFLAVLGPSGSGKSSVVRAGLVPALKQGKVPGSDKWEVITIRPATQPFEQLASAGLLDMQNGLVAAVQTWPIAHPLVERLVIVVDQFEELMVACPEAVRQAFVNDLTRLLESPAAVTIVIIMRDDFYSRFLQEAMLLTGWLERGLVNMPPTLILDELRVMVEEPAKTIGLTFEEGLVDVILNDAAEADRTKGIARSTVLPLLEFALTQLWEKRQEGKLTHDAYHAVGGVTGGLTQWADRAYYKLTSEEREIARRIFSDLARPGNEAEGVPDTRRVRVLTNLVQRNETPSEHVIDQLIRARLLSTWRDEETGLEKIEIIHDALLREWGLLRDWITENRIFLAWRDGLETQIRRWEESNRNDGALLQGLPLIEAEGWLATRKNEISAIGQQFIEAGIALREKEKAEKERLYEQVSRTSWELALAYDATIEGWSRALDLRDRETEGHTLRVTEMTLRLAHTMGISESELVHVRRGALLHDIGKMGIPDSILLKPDVLTDEEWIIMRRHPIYAYEMLWPIEFLRPALDIPYCHHEKWDGTGYPRGLKGGQIPLAARIFAVADVYVALMSDRPYRPAWSPVQHVLDYIRDQSGKHFDPEIVKTFLDMVRK